MYFSRIAGTAAQGYRFIGDIFFRKIRGDAGMKRRSFVAVLLSLSLAAAPVTAQAANGRARSSAGATAAMADQRIGGPWEMSEAELQGAGCLFSGSVATFASYATNANEVVMVAAGGTLAPSSPALLGIVLLSTIFTSGCAVGAIAAPFAYWTYRQAAPQADETDDR